MGMMEMSFLLALIFFGGSMGIPMGMPPGPEDPMMSKMAPDECVFYASWSGVAKTDPDANQTEKWLSQPVTSKSIVKLRKAYRGFLLFKGEDFEPSPKLTNQLLVEVIDAGSVNPAGVFIDKLTVAKNDVTLRAGVVVSLGDRRAVVEEIFDELYELLVDDNGARRGEVFSASTAQEINGEKIIRLSSPVGEMPINVTLRGNYFVLGIGNDALAQVAKNSETPAPKWLADIKSGLKVDRVSSVGFVDVEQARNLLQLPAWQFGFGASMDEFVEDVQSVSWVSGLDANGCISRSEIKTDKKITGLLSIIDLDPIPKRFLADVPANTTLGLATRLSTERILEMVKTTARNAGQEEPLNESLQEFQQLTGVSLEEDLLAAVGDYMHAYYTLDLNNWDSGWVASVRIEDEMSFPEIFEQINRGLKKWIEDSNDTNFVVQKHGLQEIYSVTTRNQVTNFAWAVVDDQWYFARRPAEIVNHLEGQPKENQYLNDPTVKEIFEFGDQNGLGGPVAITHLNLPHLFEAARPFVHGFFENDDNIDDDFEFAWSDIPPIDEWVNDVRPNFMAIYKTDQGFQILQRQTYPGSSPPVSIATAAIGSLPTQLAEIAGRNKMKRLGRAHLDFEEKHKHLCAAYSSDANGNALLSWRVHLLPFLGYSDLYEEFQLDEPWNSARNLPLADRMPDVYKHPSLKLDANMTVYVATTGEETAFGAPSNPGAIPPLGYKLADIQDGPENTSAIMEVNLANQVCWTIPVDLTTKPKSIRAKVQGIRDSYYFNVVLLDGTVYSVSNYLPPKTLDHLMRRNDGNEVKLRRRWIFP